MWEAGSREYSFFGSVKVRRSPPAKKRRERMYPIVFMIVGGRHMLPPRLSIHLADVISYFINLLLQSHVLFWLQMAVVVIGTSWCLALMGMVCFGGWYARTHPTTENDQIFRQLKRLLWLLTFGLTDKPSSPVESLDRGQESGVKMRG
jgi:hypothetical protein